MDLLLSSLSENGSEAKYRQITKFVRSLIVQGDLKPGARLPPIKALARQWDTNYFTVRLALTPLANEGLIERSPGRGTFVREPQSQLTSVAIYYGANLWSDPQGAFYQRLYHTLQDLLVSQNVRITTFIDTRPKSTHDAPFPELARAVEKREIQGIIALMISTEEVAWLQSLKLPLSIFGTAGIHSESEQQISVALDRLAADGCKTVGTISSPSNTHAFEKLAAARGLTTSARWCRYGITYDPNSELFGYQAFKDIWAQQMRPDGLFIHHDWICRGAITGILEMGVRVPQDLRLVLYRNQGVDYLCPWNVPSVVLDTTQVATYLIDFVEKQHRTGQLDLPPPSVPVRLVG